jgi:ketosteroid isomerase-like protein
MQSVVRGWRRLLAILMIAIPIGAAWSAEGTVSSDEAAVVAVVEQFGRALKAGQIDAAAELLDPEVLVLESGGAERDRAQYLREHAPEDAKFLQAAQIRAGQRRARVEGDLAWVGSESEIDYVTDGKPHTLLSTETMVLRRHDGAWRIVHIHWSSRPKRGS